MNVKASEIFCMILTLSLSHIDLSLLGGRGRGGRC
jgi:hypothetical protein